MHAPMRSALAIFLVILAALIAPGDHACAQSSALPAFLKQMPEPDRVIADIHGSDQLDTAARQVAALNRLTDVVTVLSGTADAPGGPQLTTEERNLNGRYAGAANSLLTTVYRLIDPDEKQRSDENSRRNQWNRLRDRYYNDAAFIGALLQRYLTPDFQEKYLGHMQQVRRNIQAPAAPQNVVPIQQTASSGSVLGGLLEIGSIIGALALGIWWLVTRKSRRHKRERARWLTNNAAAIGKFGQDKEGRAAKIDEIFDAKLATIEFKLDELKDYWIKADIGRALSAMPPKEREALRAGYHLYNFGMLKEHDFYYLRLAVVFADGNGSVIDWKQNAKSSKTVNESIANYQGPRKLDAMISQILSVLTKRPSSASDPPALKKLSARLLGDGGDLVPGAPLKSGAKGAPVEAGLILGLDEKASDTWWYYDGEGSLITVAPPGSGKTQCQVFPNLLMWKGAAVVLDVKGEIYEQTSKWRRANVGPVYKFSPLDPATSHGYNPLTEVRADPDYLWEDARFLADMMIVPSGAKDPFWEHRARDVLTAAIARVCIEQDIAKRSMGDVLDILHGVGWDKFVAYLEARVDFASMTRAGHSLASMEPKTRDGVLQSALSSMSAWDGERIGRATRKSDWSPLDLRGGKNPTIYICLKPNEVDSYISVLRVFIAQHIRSLTSTKVPAHGVQPILFILDELPRLRHMPPVEEALEIGRQYGIKLWLFAQSLGQLKEAYPNADGMIGGCAIRMFMNPSLHDETAQKVSDDIGFMDSVIDGTRVKIVEPNVLSGADYKDLVIVMAVNARAARLRKYFAYEDDALKARMGTLLLAQSLPA
jgi:type IV secretion system protein VirD4